MYMFKFKSLMTRSLSAYPSNAGTVNDFVSFVVVFANFNAYDPVAVGVFVLQLLHALQ